MKTRNSGYPNDSLAAHVLGFNGNYGVERSGNEYMEERLAVR
ncbi:MAG: hypothetical protein ACLTXL_01580 [Clostridia bacterium]